MEPAHSSAGQAIPHRTWTARKYEAHSTKGVPIATARCAGSGSATVPSGRSAIGGEPAGQGHDHHLPAGELVHDGHEGRHHAEQQGGGAERWTPAPKYQ